MRLFCVTVFVAATAAAKLDLGDVVRKAASDLAEDANLAMVEGRATAGARRPRKVTDFSRAMELRNRVLDRAVDLVRRHHGDDSESARADAETLRGASLFDQLGRDHPVYKIVSALLVKTVDDSCTLRDWPDCDADSPYRSIDGTCNNLAFPRYGAANVAMRRYVRPDYEDDVEEPVGGGWEWRGDAADRHRGGRGRGGRGPRPGGGGGVPGAPFGFRPGGPISQQWPVPRPVLRPPSGGQEGGREGLKGVVDGLLGGDKRIEQCHNYDSARRPKNLPNPRNVSATMHPDEDRPSPKVTHFVAQMGQFLDHDITLTLEHEEIEDCCGHDAGEKECFHIDVPEGDTDLCGQDCLHFARSLPFCPDLLGYREQINGITAFVDASNVYGSDDETAARLRTLEGGKLRSVDVAGKETMPQQETEDGTTELFGGDARAAENPGLSSLHTLFVREHNRIASRMAEIDATLDDEAIYQKTRRVVVSEMQNVVYGQFLTAVLGADAMKRHGLQVTAARSKYNPRTDPSIKSSFATAAFRFGHSMIQRKIKMMSPADGAEKEEFSLRDNFFSSEKYFQDGASGVDELLTGMCNQAAQESDEFVSADLTNHLFQEEGQSCGSDLVARNIQRGRDHGLPGYNDFRSFVGLSPACDWSSPPKEMDPSAWAKLKTLYDHPSEIDLFTAGLAETPVKGGVTGPTFNCIKAVQFKELKDGDRFFFSHQWVAGALDDNQYNNVRARTMRDILCDNTDISAIPANVFRPAGGKKNKSFSCQQRNKLKIKLFV